MVITYGSNAQSPELVIQAGHTAWILDFTVSPNHKYMATASGDMSVKLWDLASKKEIRTFRGHKDWVTTVAFSNDNKMIASGDEQGNVFMWDINTGKLLDTFVHYTYIRTIAFSNDGTRIATFGDYGEFWVREVKTKKVLTSYKMSEQGLKLQFLPRNNNLVTYSTSDTTFVIWDIKADSCPRSIFYRKGRFTDFTLSRNGQYVLSLISSDSGIRVWDLKNWKPFKKLKSYNHFPDHIVLGEDDSTFYTSANFSFNDSNFIELKKWNLYSAKCLDSATMRSESFYTSKLEFSPATKELVFLYGLARIATVNVNPLRFSQVLNSSSTLINIVVEEQPGKFILVGEDGPVKELSVSDNNYHILFPSSGRNHISKLVLLNDALHGIIKMAFANYLFKLDLKTFEKTPLIKDSNTTRNFVLSPDNKIVAYYTTSAIKGRFQKHSEIVVKQLNSDSLLFKHIFGTHLLIPFGIADNGKTILFQDKRDTIMVVSFAQPAIEQYLCDTAFHYQNVSEFISMENGLLLTSTYQGKLFLWNRETGKLLRSISAHPGSLIYKVAFSPDSSRFLTLADKVVKLWDAKTFQLIRSFNGHESWVSEGGFMLNGKQIYTTGGDYTFRIWDIETGAERASFMMVDTADMVTRLPNTYYAATKQGMKHLSYRINNELYPFEQFDLQFNRPHLVLRSLGATDSALVKGYEKAYYRRLKKAGFKESDFNNDLHLPVTVIPGKNLIPPIIGKRTIQIGISLYDDKYKLDRYFVSINNVPINGMNGTSLKSRFVNNLKLKIPLQLTEGKNKIQVSCMNNKGVESLRKDLFITYQPLQKIIPKVYFFGIGISRYKDSSHNLTYADKDTRDLARIIIQRYPNALIDTLLNKSATAASILELKAKLKKTAIDDIVIVSVSSHGLLDKNQDYYIGTYDVDFTNPMKKGLRYEDLQQLLDDIPARKKLLLIDACHSGEVDKEDGLTEIINPSTFKTYQDKVSGKGIIAEDDYSSEKNRYRNSLEIMNDLFADVSRTNGAVVISAAGGREFAFEDSKWNNGVFTYCIKKALLEKLADTNDDGISVNELRKYVSEQVNKLTDGRQQPTTRQENIEFDWRIW